MFFCFVTSVNASTLKNNFNTWLRFYFTGPLHPNSKFEYFLQTEARLRSNSPNFRASVTRAAIGYRINPKLIVWLGYTVRPYLSTSNNDLSNNDLQTRNDIFEQVDWKLYANPNFTLKSRLRIEQRKDSTSSVWLNRIRTKFSLTVPIKDTRYSYLIYDELFFNLNHPSWASDKIFSQDRGFVGLRIALKHTASFDVGYLNQLQLDSAGDDMNHTLYFALNVATN